MYNISNTKFDVNISGLSVPVEQEIIKTYFGNGK